MDRRAFLGTLGLLTAPLAAEAQPRANKQRIVVLSLSSPPEHARALEDGLRALGYVPGATITIEHRSAISEAPQLPVIAEEAIASRPDVIAAIGTTAALSARRVTRDIPIVTVAGDIVAAGLVANLGRPEGNVTGLSFFAVDLLLKRLEVLRAAARARGIEVREVLLARFEDVTPVFAQRRDSRETLILCSHLSSTLGRQRSVALPPSIV
jgi:putative tryptophan/tyrosine transport system substrate-binding protein